MCARDWNPCMHVQNMLLCSTCLAKSRTGKTFKIIQLSSRSILIASVWPCFQIYVYIHIYLITVKEDPLCHRLRFYQLKYFIRHIVLPFKEQHNLIMILYMFWHSKKTFYFMWWNINEFVLRMLFPPQLLTSPLGVNLWVCNMVLIFKVTCYSSESSGFSMQWVNTNHHAK